MAEPDRGGKRTPQGERDTAESPTVRTNEGTAPAPRPRPVATKPKQSVGVPMAGQSYAKKQAEEARRAKGVASPPPSPPVSKPAPMPRPRPPVAEPAPEPDLDLDEDFDLEEEYEEDLRTEESTTAQSASKLYSTRRALAEQVNQDVAERPDQVDTSGMAALKERREAWKKMVAKKEEQGQSPYVSRWAKVSFFPLIYFGISMMIVRNLRYEWAEFYSYDPFYILMGLIVGFIFLVIASTATMLRARRVKKPILLKGKTTWIGLLVFIGISFFLAFTQGLAYTWLFSIGFLGAGLLIVGIGFLLERSGKGTFWVKDPMEGSDKRWLEFVPTVEG